jgi:MFS transporter, putative metabolite:H+ symporter
MDSKKIDRKVLLIIVVASLGYFVDIYDLILFNVIKKESLLALGLSLEEINVKGIELFNYQMAGMLLGGIFWGILGDKKGRIKVLFGSILMYSIANIANAFVTNLEVYALIRFLAGVGLAGELGAGITLISETMSKENRGYGTMIIVTFGALGAVLAALVGAEGAWFGNILTAILNIQFQNWQVAYIIGGILGLVLLALRVGTMESGMFKSIEAKSEVPKGAFLSLFTKKDTFLKYLYCILIGLPIWYVIGIMIALAEHFSGTEVLNIDGKVINGTAIMLAYIGLSVGDLISGLLSQWFRSRKKVIYLYILLSIVTLLLYLYSTDAASPLYFYTLCLIAGIATGYWALFVTIASEQFGTNIRSTVTTTAPNFVRGAVIPITLSFTYLELGLGTKTSALIVGLVCMGLALYSTYKVDETFGKDLNYNEQ